MKVGNGKSIHFWFDNWMGNGRLIDITGAMGTTYLGVRRHTMVSEAVTLGDWIIQGKRSRQYHHLYESILAKEAPTLAIKGMMLYCGSMEKMILNLNSQLRLHGRKSGCEGIKSAGVM